MGRNKPRHKFKKNGVPSGNYCQDCLSWNCDTMFFEETIATTKRLSRRKQGLCEACGSNPCKCKNKKGY